jgi:ubiquinone/menaquinone biosynthesis C-methylase UbiE
MATRKDTLFERFLAPVFNLFVNQEELNRFYQSVDWQTASQRLTNPAVIYPMYYSSQNFHGIEGGYLTPGAAVSYDAVTHYALPPGESFVRQALIDAIQTQPRRILDLGCGTGSTTVMLKQAFPEAEVIGLDLSPYMLVAAQYKADQAGLDIHWRHGRAEHTGFPDAAFDLITASLLFHETPPMISQAILQESYRLLTVGGEVLVLDGHQKVLRQTEWLTNIFEEPYIREYAAESVDAWMGAAGFSTIQTQDVWLVHQLTRGVKPLQAQAVKFADLNMTTEGMGQWAPG